VYARILTALTGTLLLLATSGCIVDNFDNYVYFENTTDQDLVLIGRSDKTPRKLPAHEKTRVTLGLHDDQCEAWWLIYDSAGTTLVKDPGKICLHQTITIP
jgi:hypothetical protein